MTGTLAPVFGASWVTPQLLVDGTVNGLVIGLIALGVVLIYRSTRVINFAVGNMGLIGASLLPLLTLSYGWPFWPALVASVAAGVVFALVVELVVIRRLFEAARVTVLVATIGVAQLALAVVAALPTVKGVFGASYPVAVDGEWTIGDVRLTGSQLTIVVVVPAAAFALSWFLNRTTTGHAVTASADNPRLARTVGISPKSASTIVWVIAGLLSTVSMILISGQSGGVTALADLGPNTMVRALAAAVIAGMVSFRWSVVAGIGVGVGQALVRFNLPDQTGLVDFLLFLAILVAVWFRARQDRDDEGSFGFTPRVRPVPEHLRSIWWVRHLGTMAFVALGLVAIAVPLVLTAPSSQLLATTVVAFAICATSLTILTGWAGQLSLGQMAFAGLGALLAAALARGLEAEVTIGSLRFALALPRFTFVSSILIATALTALLAAVIGLGALRVRGLLLAVSTFAFGVATAQYLYRRPVLSDGNAQSVRFARGDLVGLDLDDQRTYFYVVLAVLAITLVIVARLRRSGIGRTTVAVRDNPDSAAAATVSPFRTKIVAFTLAGAIAGLGGALLAGAIGSVPLSERLFQVQNSLDLVAMAVIGGLGTVAGPVLGALWVVGLPGLFPDNEVIPLFASSIGLLVLLLYLPGGLMQVVHQLRDAVLARAEARVGPAPARAASLAGAPPAGSVTSVVERPAPRIADPAGDGAPAGGPPALTARDIAVRFGGIRAVDGVGVEVGPGEIVGLIGANGAGKSTLLNAIGGFVPAIGTVELGGVDLSRRSAAQRARAGLGRTFQAARLFPDLTVRETVLVALEARGRTGLLSTALFWPPATGKERAKRAEASALIDLVGLGRFADVAVADLSTGTRRIVELAGLVALDARVLCLDEPTAGVAQRETEALAPLLLALRAELDASMIVIEHDMPFIAGLSDRLVCLEAGRVIAEGTPDAVRRDPLVVASYLGTDARAIDRSDAPPAGGPARGGDRTRSVRPDDLSPTDVRDLHADALTRPRPGAN